MKVDEFLNLLREERLEDGVSNVVQPPATVDDMEAWDEEHPEFALPETYKLLLSAANGFTIHASSDSPNGMLRLLPLHEVRPLADQLMEVCGLEEEDITDPPTCLMVGEDQDSVWCLGLDTATGEFLEVGYSGETTPIGPLEDALDWISQRLNDWKS